MRGISKHSAFDHRVSSGGRFTWTGFAALFCAAPLVGLAFARVGGTVRFYFAPAVLAPVLVGALIGLTMVAVMRFGQCGNRPTILSAAVAAAVAAAMAGGTPAPQLRFDPVFALLAVAASVAVVFPALRIPYCDRCGSWFRTIDNGKIDLPASRRLAELLDVDLPDRARSPRYRLSACRGECGPTQCELSWERIGGGVDLAILWLDAEQRNKVVAIVDESDVKESGGSLTAAPTPDDCETASGSCATASDRVGVAVKLPPQL